VLKTQVVDDAKSSRLPRPDIAHLSFRTPPDPGITSPASGSSRRVACNFAYSSSDKYCVTSFVKSGVSTKVSTAQLYVSDVSHVYRRGTAK
jgi:hypothetical protein